MIANHLLLKKSTIFIFFYSWGSYWKFTDCIHAIYCPIIDNRIVEDFLSMIPFFIPFIQKTDPLIHCCMIEYVARLRNNSASLPIIRASIKSNLIRHHQCRLSRNLFSKTALLWSIILFILQVKPCVFVINIRCSLDQFL